MIFKTTKQIIKDAFINEDFIVMNKKELLYGQSNKRLQEVWVCVDDLKKEIENHHKFVAELDNNANYDIGYIGGLRYVLDLLCNSQEQKESSKNSRKLSVSCEQTGEDKNGFATNSESSPVQNPILVNLDTHKRTEIIINKKCTCKKEDRLIRLDNPDYIICGRCGGKL